ncbi:hypothetical protein EXIGLDRAFT_781590 [Exidia glandulosa HHB12029]|uniref:Tr-type G domain-containing protein n=1 Tax=Exidia glandulosa HHB12029 TaxID=1314781 RepID=A0A165B6T7_EXIGL|nr:hypothetical protein EXIGLDRAFT_781590 [Exidia glandulosa HHB12029]
MSAARTVRPTTCSSSSLATARRSLPRGVAGSPSSTRPARYRFTAVPALRIAARRVAPYLPSHTNVVVHASASVTVIHAPGHRDFIKNMDCVAVVAARVRGSPLPNMSTVVWLATAHALVSPFRCIATRGGRRTQCKLRQHDSATESAGLARALLLQVLFYVRCTHTVAPRSPEPTIRSWTRMPCVSAQIAATYAEQYGATLACCTVYGFRMLRTLYTPL